MERKEPKELQWLWGILKGRDCINKIQGGLKWQNQSEGKTNMHDCLFVWVNTSREGNTSNENAYLLLAFRCHLFNSNAATQQVHNLACSTHYKPYPAVSTWMYWFKYLSLKVNLHGAIKLITQDNQHSRMALCPVNRVCMIDCVAEMNENKPLKQLKWVYSAPQLRPCMIPWGCPMHSPIFQRGKKLNKIW